MDSDTKKRAVEPLVGKARRKDVTHAGIAGRAGYSERQPKRIVKELAERGEGTALAHGNAGRRPAGAATEDEVRYLRELKRPYPNASVAHFGGILLEDVPENTEPWENSLPDPGKQCLPLGGKTTLPRGGKSSYHGKEILLDVCRLVEHGPSWSHRLFGREGCVSPAARGHDGAGGWRALRPVRVGRGLARAPGGRRRGHRGRGGRTRGLTKR